MKKSITRRGFLARTAACAVAAPSVVSSTALGLAGAVAPSNRIAMGFIGLGGRGTGGLGIFRGQPDVQVVALCDVSTDNRWRKSYPIGGLEPARLATGLPPQNAHRDFRDLLGRGDIDAVQIATSERWHPVIAATAARAGIDCYCEKPLALSIADGIALREVCHRHGTIFQFGTQQRSFSNFRHAAELVRNQRIGELHTVKVGAFGSHVDSSLPGVYVPGPIPEELDYDLWTGPSPLRPFVRDVASQAYTYVSDYGNGYISSWGIHHLDSVQWAMGTDGTGPVEIEGKGIRPRLPGYCDTLTAWDVEMKYANGVRVIYTDNSPKIYWQVKASDQEWLFQQAGKHPKNRQGILFEGTEGWVFVSRDANDAYPKSLLREQIGPNEIHLPVSPLHERNFLDCVKSRAKTLSNIDVAVRTDALCHLSILATEIGRKLRWDPANERFLDDEEANRLLVRAMREPWHV